MTKQIILFGIIAGVFIAGIGLGYAVFTSTSSPTTLNSPYAMNQWMNSMMNDPYAMNQWMDTMTSNPRFMQQFSNRMGTPMLGYMMNDPQERQEMYDIMFQHSQFMQGMMTNQKFQQNWMGPWMMNNTSWNGMMGSGSGPMMGNGLNWQK